MNEKKTRLEQNGVKEKWTFRRFLKEWGDVIVIICPR